MGSFRMLAPQATYPVIGHLRSLRWIARFGAAPIEASCEIGKRYGPLVAFDLSPPLAPRSRLVFVGSGARINESVLARPDDYRPGAVLLRSKRGTALHRLGNGIFSRTGQEHVELRKAYAKPQSPRLIRAIEPRLRELVVSEVAGWPTDGQGDLVALVQAITRRASIRFLLGDLDERDVFAIANAVERLMVLNASWKTYAVPFNLPGTSFGALHATAEHAERLIREIVMRRIASGVRGNDIVSALLDRAGAAPGPAVIDDIVSQVPTIFAASQETCKVAIPWTLFLLCQHPEHYAEVVDWIGSKTDESADGGDHQRDPLVRAIRESMRLLPAIPFVWRVARRSTDIVGHPVAPGWRVLLSQFRTNRDPEVFPDPDRFAPERWKTIHPTHYAFADYSAGSRRCIGFHFAEALQPIAIREILMARTLKLVDNQRVDHTVAVTLRPRGPILAEMTGPGGRPQRRRIRGGVSKLVAY